MTAKGFTTFKFIILGQSGVGKSCLLSRYLKDKFDTQYQATVGCEFAKNEVKIGQSTIILQIWDTAGQQTFRSIIKNLYNKTSACFISFSIAQKKSFEKTSFWLKEARQNCPADCMMILVGTQCDRSDQRAVSKQQAGLYAKDQGFEQYMQTSAKDCTNTAKRVFEKYEAKAIERIEQSTQLKQDKKQQKKGCCGK